MEANRQHKNSVFTLLLGQDKDALREIYGAIEGVFIDPNFEVTVDTLDDVLFMDRNNDISFEIGDKLVILMEHQSSINPNMPLRMLFYIARIYENIIKRMKGGEKKIYSSAEIKVPRPEFIVLYNGEAPYPDEAVVKLSSLFADTVFMNLDNAPRIPLELSVKIYNINEGHNSKMVRKNAKLKGYSIFIGKVREFTEELRIAGNHEKPTDEDKREGIKRAVKWCIENGVLKDFMLEHGKEVGSMLWTEWNWDDAKEVWQEEAKAEGRMEDVTKLLKYGLTPEQVSEALEIPINSIPVYQMR
ncbi:MAG: Rpn family recombination-promoting nuclease/putative transposase [Spirochaetaceae bacterium]|jgi:hypothetical protein|nr:Rpn family recombination-promoting nuclease/putative transposase [Spirochaetaceae bacterium]